MVWHWLLKLAHECITIRLCVAYIHDQDKTLKFDLKVKFIGVFNMFRVRPIYFFSLTSGNHIWHMGLSPLEDVTRTFMFPIRCWPYTSVKFIGFCHVFMFDLYFLLASTLAYHIWHMALSPWEDVSSTFMILTGRWPLTSRSNL